MKRLLLAAFFLIGCKTPPLVDDYHPAKQYTERGWVRDLKPALWDYGTFKSTPMGQAIVFEREEPKGDITQVVIWGTAPVWVGLHCSLTIYHGCTDNFCGDYIMDVRRIE